MPHLSSFTLVDIVVTAVVVLAVAGALRRRAGLLGAAGAAIGSLLMSWVVVVGLATWGPSAVAHAADHSRLLQTAPAPRTAVEQARHLVDHVSG